MYGQQVRLRELWQRHCGQFHTVPSPVYGESQVRLRYDALDLLWRPVGQLVRLAWWTIPAAGA